MTKKLLSLLLCMIMLLALCGTAFADAPIEWEISKKGVLTISGDGELPDYSYVAPPWENRRKDIKSVVVEEGVTSISPNTFQYCTNLKTVTLPSTLTELGKYAFYKCSSLKSVVMPESMDYIGKNCFDECRKLEEIVIPYGIEEIPEAAFANCMELRCVTIPVTVDEIGHSAFINCNKLKDVYYSGSSDDWDDIDIDKQNKSLVNASIHVGAVPGAPRTAAAGKSRVIDVCAVMGETICLMSDGTVKAAGGNSEINDGVRGWTDIESISASRDHVVGVKEDGTVLAVGDNGMGQCNVDTWRGITEVSTCYAGTLGLRSDGTVVFTGELPWQDDAGVQKYISTWKNVKKIQTVAEGDRYIFGVTEDGRAYGGYACEGWESIADLHSSGWLTFGLKKNGTVVVPAGTENYDIYRDVAAWTDVARVYAGDGKALAVKKDGTVLFSGGDIPEEYRRELAGWRDIKELYNVDDAIIGLKKDGSVVIVSTPRKYPTLDEAAIKQVAAWTDIEKISVSDTHAVGLKKDGTLVFAGDNSHGQFNIT